MMNYNLFKFNFNWKLKGFSLAEMMIVMLILSIVLAASVPIITHRVVAGENQGQVSSSPPGSVISFAGASVPDGWLLCDGRAYSTTGQYADLYNAIGYTYGGSGGSFNVPNLIGRIPVGSGSWTDSYGTVAYSSGTTGGERLHLLTTGEMPSHSHPGYTDSQGTHTHTFSSSANGISGSFITSGSSFTGVGTVTYYSGKETSYYGGYPLVSLSGAIVSNGAHTHNVSTSAIGGGTTHNNMQPYIAINYIIKY